MPHPLVLRLRFTGKEFVRGLKDVKPPEVVRHFEPMKTYSDTWVCI